MQDHDHHHHHHGGHTHSHGVSADADRRYISNIEGSFQHLLTDLYAFIGTLIAGLVVLATGFDRADALASLLVAGLMFRSGYELQRKAIRVLLEGVPEGMAPGDVGSALAHGEHVRQVHDLPCGNSRLDAPF